MEKNIIFLGSKPIGLWCLEHLLARQKELKVRIVGIRSKDNKNLQHKSLIAVAKENGISVLESLDAISDLENPIDHILSVQHHEILKEKHIRSATHATNLHMAPLPEYRGCNQFSFAIIDRAKEFGTTLHQMKPGIDDGDILFENRFPLSEKATVKDLYEETEKQSKRLWEAHIGDVLSGNYSATPQSELVTTRGTSIHYRAEIDTIKTIDITWPPEKIERHIRATYMPEFPPPYAFVNGRKIDLVPHEIQ